MTAKSNKAADLVQGKEKQMTEQSKAGSTFIYLARRSALLRVYIHQQPFQEFWSYLEAGKEIKWQPKETAWKYDSYFYPTDGSITLAAGLALSVFPCNLKLELKEVPNCPENYFVDVSSF